MGFFGDLWSGIKKVGKTVGGAVGSVGRAVGHIAKKVGKGISYVASPVVNAVQWVGEKTGLDKPVKAIAGAVSGAVRDVGSAIENSGAVGQALASAYNITSAFNPVAYGIDAGLGASDVISGKTSVGDALVGVGLSKFKKGKQLIKGLKTVKGINYAKERIP